MAGIAVNATDAFSAGSSNVKATTATGTIPSGAGIGDVIFLVLTSSDTSTNGSAPALTVTSTGSAWTQIGSTEACTISGFANVWSSIWWVKVASADQGATVTVHSSISYYLAAAAAGYSNVSGTSPVDAFTFTAATSGQETVPTGTVTAAGGGTDWLLYLASLTSSQSMVSVTKPAACTLRESYFAFNEAYAGIADTNGVVAAGTQGGASWTSGYYSGYVMWTVAVSNASGTAHPGTATLSGSGTLGGAGVFAGGAIASTYATTYGSTYPGITGLSGTGTLGGTGTATGFGGGAVLSGTGTLGATWIGVLTEADTLSGTGTLGATWVGVLVVPPSALSGSGTLNLTGVRLGFQAGLSGTGTIFTLATGGLVFGTSISTPYAYPLASQVMVAPPGTTSWVPLGSVGVMTALTYSFTCPGGADAMTAAIMVPASYRTQLFNVGWQVRITRGGHQVWDGKLDEPIPTSSGWNLTASGTGNRGQDFLAVYSSTWPASQPDQSINNAIARGMPWNNTAGIGTPSGAWYGQAVDSGAQTITALLNLLCTRGGLTWYVNSQPGGYPGDDLSVFPLPTVPNRLLSSVNPAPRTLGGDINTIYIRYEISADNTATSAPAAYGLTSAQNAASVAAHGVMETYIDLSDVGVMTAAAAQAVGNSVLAIYQRASFAGPFTASYGQLMTSLGVPIDPGCDQAGTMVKLILSDFGYGGEVQPNLPITFIVSSYTWDDLAQVATLVPYQNVDTSLTGLLSLANTELTPVAVAS